MKLKYPYGFLSCCLDIRFLAITSIQDLKQQYAGEMEAAVKTPNYDTEIMDAIHAASFGSTGLGLPILANAATLPSVTCSQ